MTNKSKIKIISFSLVTLVIIFFIFKNNFLNINQYIFEKLPIKTKVIIRSIKKNNQNSQNISTILNNFFNDYNEKYLPETQQINLNLDTKKIIFDESFRIDKSYLEFVPKKPDKAKTHFYSFFMEQYKKDIIISDYIGNIYFIKKNELISKKSSIKPNKVATNLSLDKVLDIFVHEDELYISYAIGKSKDCYNWNIYKASINYDNLKFNKLYTSKDCSSQNFYQPQGGRIEYYVLDNKPGIIITIGENGFEEPSADTIFGKILFIPLDRSDPFSFSTGHRNPQGLWSEDGVILATEHGPRGGDEINRITLNSNYGWPYASYGEPYGPKKKDPKYFKDHNANGYVEPVFSFLKAIGISELIKLPNNFSNFWQDNFILSSLWGHSIFRIKFDKNYNKVIFLEKIYLGKRIRDIMYLNDEKMIILSLEELGEIGIIKNQNE